MIVANDSDISLEDELISEDFPDNENDYEPEIKKTKKRNI